MRSSSVISTTLVEIFSSVFVASSALNVIAISPGLCLLSPDLYTPLPRLKKAQLKRVLSIMIVSSAADAGRPGTAEKARSTWAVVYNWGAALPPGGGRKGPLMRAISRPGRLKRLLSYDHHVI